MTPVCLSIFTTSRPRSCDGVGEWQRLRATEPILSEVAVQGHLSVLSWYFHHLRFEFSCRAAAQLSRPQAQVLWTRRPLHPVFSPVAHFLYFARLRVEDKRIGDLFYFTLIYRSRCNEDKNRISIKKISGIMVWVFRDQTYKHSWTPVYVTDLKTAEESQ